MISAPRCHVTPDRFAVVLGSILFLLGTASHAQELVPGTGQQVIQVGDDFEDPSWGYQYNLPKVYNNKDNTQSKNMPGGRSDNDRWFEGLKRGQPDLVRRVATPPNGLVGSTGALEIRSLKTGGRTPSYVQQQEDLIANVQTKIGKIPASRSPSIVTRVWMPPLNQWDQREGCHFAFRMSLETKKTMASRRGFFKNSSSDNSYWPGIFLNLARNPQAKPGENPYYIDFWIKATADGRRIQGPRTTTTGWWTLGMSVTPDGKVHYYAKPGTADLTSADFIGADFPFGKRAERLRSFFFNVCNGDDGRTWSSQFIIDDPSLFVVR